jgi:hypothetical protein
MKMGNTRPLFGAIVGYDGEYPLVKKRGTFTEERVEEVKLAIATALTKLTINVASIGFTSTGTKQRVSDAIIEEILVTPASLRKHHDPSHKAVD